MTLKRCFEKYCLFDRGLNRSQMDSKRFQKMLRDSKLVSEQGLLTSAGAYEVFRKIKPGTRSNVNFVQMIEGLRHVSIVHRVSLNEIMERIAVVGGPIPMIAPPTPA